MGYYNNNLSGARDPVYIEDETEKVLNSKHLLVPLCCLREIYKDFPDDSVADFLGVTLVQKCISGKNICLILRYDYSDKSLLFALHRNEGEHFFTISTGKGYAPIIVNRQTGEVPAA